MVFKQRKKWSQMRRHEKIASVLSGVVSIGTGIVMGNVIYSYNKQFPDDPFILKAPACVSLLAATGLCGGILGATTESFVLTIHDQWEESKLKVLGKTSEKNKEDDDDE